MDDKISAEDYGEMSENLKKERLKYQDELQELKAQNTDYHTWIKTELTLSLIYLKGLLIATLKRNKQLLVRYFLKNYNLTGKKFEPLFSMKHCSIFLVLTKGCSIIKKGQLNKNIKLSYKAPLVGLEPFSDNFFRDLKKLQDLAQVKRSTEDA